MADLKPQLPPDWETMPRLLQELCDGHPGYSVACYAFDGFGSRQWLCRNCWGKEWQRYKQALAASTVPAKPVMPLPNALEEPP